MNVELVFVNPNVVELSASSKKHTSAGQLISSQCEHSHARNERGSTRRLVRETQDIESKKVAGLDRLAT